MKMNRKLLVTGIALIACLLNRGIAQTLILPTTPDIPWYGACTPGIGVYIAGLNTAMIDCAGDPSLNIRPSTLIVSDYYGNGTAGGVSMRDVNSGFTMTFQYCGGPSYFGNSPDIIVGNDATLPLTDYRVAVAFVDAFTGAPQIDYYLVHYIATGVFTAGLIWTTTFPGIKSATVHLDIMANSNLTGITGKPWCNRFVVTWDDFVTNWSYANLASLNGPLPPTIGFFGTTIALNSGSGVAPMAPDVAAIRRWVVPCGACIATVDRLGLFVTIENGNQLFYQEHDWNTGITTPPVPLGGIWAGGAMLARIDAPDDHNINNPLTPGLCYYKAVAQVSPAPGFYQSFVYDNMVPGGQNDAGYMPFMMGMYSPTVAYGGNGGTEYQVLHYADEYAGLGPIPNVFMEPINWNFPASTIIPDAVIPWQPYFRINSAPPSFANGNYMNSISTPCNNPAGLTLCAWADNNVMIPSATVYYKVSAYGGPNGYSYKHSNEEPAVKQPETWKIYPNPASTQLTVENNETCTYDITDMTGRKVMNGALEAGKQTLDISELAAGSYIITSYSEGMKKDHANFVKQ